LLFCLLGGHGIPFELNASAASVLIEQGVWRHVSDAAWLERQLSTAQFEPRRRTGQLRRYRYPSAASRRIAAAFEWVEGHGPLTASLRRYETDAERRDWLCSCPGVGPKTASWLLRNTGWGREVAILDVHVMRALRDGGRVSGASLPRDYIRAERAYLQWAEDLGLCPAQLDLFLWDVYRIASRVAVCR